MLSRCQARHQSEFSDLPDGTFVHFQCAAWVVKGRWMLRYDPSGYDCRVAKPTGIAEVLTPKSIVPVLSSKHPKYPIELHESALRLCNPHCDAEAASPRGLRNPTKHMILLSRKEDSFERPPFRSAGKRTTDARPRTLRTCREGGGCGPSRA